MTKRTLRHKQRLLAKEITDLQVENNFVDTKEIRDKKKELIDINNKLLAKIVKKRNK